MKGAPEVRQLICGGEENDTKIKPAGSKVWREVLRTCRFVQEVGQQAAHDSLVADNQHVFLPFKLHDDWLQTMDQVLIRLHKREIIIHTLTMFGLSIQLD